MRKLALLALVALCSLPAVPVAARRPVPMARQSLSVIAVVDTGTNPYHLDFRRPRLTQHPSTYIQGFPRAAEAIHLTFDAPDWKQAVKADEQEWEKVAAGELVWFPGTNIIGAIGPFDSGDQTPILDEGGHGTGTSSLAAGAIHGPASERVLVVIVKGYTDGLAWAAAQPWIDVITNSWGPFLGVVGLDRDAIVEASYDAVASGKIVCFATGNTSTPGYHDPTAGPSWLVNVGAASATTRGEHYYTVYPNDILGLSGVPAAAHDSYDDERGFGGTSAASPNSCGRVSALIAEARAAAGDRREGPHGGGLVVSGAGTEQDGGYLGDGVVTRAELEDAFQSTAVPAEPAPPDPNDLDSIPALPLVGFVRGGYGIVDGDSVVDALAVILGATPRPERSLEDMWFEYNNMLRDAIWGEPPP